LPEGFYAAIARPKGDMEKPYNRCWMKNEEGNDNGEMSTL